MNGEIVLVVEDDQVTMKALEALLEVEGFQVVGAACATEVVRAVRKQMPDLMILDLRLARDDPYDNLSDGLAVLQWLRRAVRGVDFPVIIHTGYNSPSLAMWARARGVFAVVDKGEDPSELLGVIHQALEEGVVKQAA